MRPRGKVLVLSIGYGMGHHAAARAAAEELARRGYAARCVDPCVGSNPRLFALTQRFYRFCVRKAPWLWGVTYEQTDNSDWRSMLWLPGLASCMRSIDSLIGGYNPDACLCTYPLFAHILDSLGEIRGKKIPYGVVVTDALEISRPWATSEAPLICVTDPLSRTLLESRYGISPGRIVVTGFPVRSAFGEGSGRSAPSPQNLNLLYGAFVSPAQVRRDVRAIKTAYPQARLVVVAGERYHALEHLLGEYPDRFVLLGEVPDMQPLFAEAHIYIGKAGAATLFEAYASLLPVIVNYALPGQEQGNLRLLLEDRCGLFAEGTDGLLHAINSLLDADAAMWRACSSNMSLCNRAGGAKNIVDEMERRFLKK